MLPNSNTTWASCTTFVPVQNVLSHVQPFRTFAACQLILLLDCSDCAPGDGCRWGKPFQQPSGRVACRRALGWVWREGSGGWRRWVGEEGEEEGEKGRWVGCEVGGGGGGGGGGVCGTFPLFRPSRETADFSLFFSKKKGFLVFSFFVFCFFVFFSFLFLVLSFWFLVFSFYEN